MGSIFNRAMNIVVSFIWALASKLARKLSRSRVRLPVRVVSVGNLQVGGAGKTPLVAFLSRQAIQRGKRVCILTRGYGSEWEFSGGVVFPGNDPADADQCGDEAALLHDLVPEAWIGVGADRSRQFADIQKLCAERGVGSIDLVVLDDGFQHHRLFKDLEVVALTSSRWGERLFRDFQCALKGAHLVAWTKGDRRPDPKGRPMVRFRMEIPNVESQQAHLLVTGLADGNYAKGSAERAGYRIAKHLRFRDHARYAPAVTQAIFEEARTDGLKLMMTGKDWVKWRQVMSISQKSVPIEVIEPAVQLDASDEKIWNQVIWGE
jgi:tetraacyldisaccharide 4'-kinase